MKPTFGRAVMCAVAVPTALTLLSGCGMLSGGGPAVVSGTAAPAVNSGSSAAATAPAGTGGSASAAPTGSPSEAGSPSGTGSPAANGGSGQGCPAGGAALPAGADARTTADLDGDGKPDEIWLADRGSTRLLGVRTASGARFSTAYTSGGPTGTSAVAGRLGDGSAVILLDFTREARLFAVTGCKIVPTTNSQGQQYTFDGGLTGYGSGAGCPEIGSTGRHLVGYLAKPGGFGDGYVVTRTTIDLSRNGTRASNGTVRTLGEGLPESSPVVKTAKRVTCGAGGRAVEPPS